MCLGSITQQWNKASSEKESFHCSKFQGQSGSFASSSCPDLAHNCPFGARKCVCVHLWELKPWLHRYSSQFMKFIYDLSMRHIVENLNLAKKIDSQPKIGPFLCWNFMPSLITRLVKERYFSFLNEIALLWVNWIWSESTPERLVLISFASQMIISSFWSHEKCREKSQPTFILSCYKTHIYPQWLSTFSLIFTLYGE